MRNTELISERQLRVLLRDHLQSQTVEPGARLFEELAIEQGSARVDLAVVGSKIEAYEIKSDFDSFSRLHNQIHAYNRVFDRITIVTGTVYTAAALELMPSWWGVWSVIHRTNESLELNVVRSALDNPNQSLRSMAMFLWRDEAFAILKAETGTAPPKRSTKRELHDWLSNELSLDALRGWVTHHLLNRNLATRQTRSTPSGGWSHHDASYSDFHCLT